MKIASHPKFLQGDLILSSKEINLRLEYQKSLIEEDLDNVKYMITNGLIKLNCFELEKPLQLSIKLGDLGFVKELTEKYNVMNRRSMVIALENERYDILYYFFELGETIEGHREQMYYLNTDDGPYDELLKMKEKYDKLKKI